MALQQKANSVLLQDHIVIFWRRKWRLVISLMLGVVAGYVACFFIPPSYQSSTLILIESQKVPISYGTPTVPGTVDDRLRTISQQIGNQANLAKIIKEYNLYKREDGGEWQHTKYFKDTRWLVFPFDTDNIEFAGGKAVFDGLPGGFTDNDRSPILLRDTF